MNVRHAAHALRDSVRAVPGDLDHPAYEQLEALVDGGLNAADREIVESHAALCAQCREDIDDLSAVRDALASQPAIAASPRTGWRGAAIAAAIAASLALAIWLGRPAAPPLSTPVASAPAPTPASTPQDLLTPEERGAVDRAIAAGQVELPAPVAALQAEPGTLLGDASGTAMIPVGPISTAVASARPAFRWQAVPGARAYSVTVFDDRFKLVARSNRIAATSWTPESDLPREQSLAWQVTAHLDGSDLVGPAPPQPEARFRVVGAGAAEKARQQAARLANRPLELGILLAGAGLLDDAREQLRKAETNPGTQLAARSILAGLMKR